MKQRAIFLVGILFLALAVEGRCDESFTISTDPDSIRVADSHPADGCIGLIVPVTRKKRKLSKAQKAKILKAYHDQGEAICLTSDCEKCTPVEVREIK